MPIVDRSLLQAAHRGDRDAFAEIARGHLHVVFATAPSIMQSPAGEDVVQDSFVRRWTRWE